MSASGKQLQQLHDDKQLFKPKSWLDNAHHMKVNFKF